MPTSSAPGKVYLFGEHAVVYGEPAVPCAIERRAAVTVTRRDDGRVTVAAPDLELSGFSVAFGPGEEPAVSLPSDRAKQAVRYVDAALDQARDTADADAETVGFDVRVDSDLPLGAGLGSSAAVSVATIDAAARALGVDLSPADVADRGYQVEHGVQSGEASRADTFCAAMGGAVRVEGDDCREIEAPSDLPLAVGYDGGGGDTGELVAMVRGLKDEYTFAADAVTAIGDLVRAGEAVLADGAVDELGRLMDVNHGLLAALGVSSRSLDAMVWAAREAGAPGAKLTGAGGGGCIVCLDPDGEAVRSLRLAPDCIEAFPAPLDVEGLRRESA
ncbi:MAG: mevalonate kinase [Halobacteriales archaeon]|nr:mevalonate kinase [Halobacteriales archaeon]